MIKKIIVAAVLLIAILVGGTGCMLNRILDANPLNNIDAQALSYLEKKYGEPFAFADAYGNTMSGTREFFVTCDSLPGQQILVQVENYESDNRIFRDNYLAVKYQEETVAFFRDCASVHYADVNIYYEVKKEGQSADLAGDASFEEYLADGHAKLIVMMELKASQFTGKQQMDEIVEKIEQACPYVTLTVIVVEDDVFGTKDRAALNYCISHREYVAQATIYIENNSIRSDWRGEGVANG